MTRTAHELVPVRGMACGGCERRVREALEALPGVERALPEHIGDEVEVYYDPAVVDLDGIRAAVRAAGFAA